MFKFAEGDTVALIGDYPNLGLSAGAVGTVWAMYTTTPPCYEVTWQDKDGLDFDMTMDEEELAKPEANCSDDDLERTALQFAPENNPSVPDA